MLCVIAAVLLFRHIFIALDKTVMLMGTTDWVLGIGMERGNYNGPYNSFAIEFISQGRRVQGYHPINAIFMSLEDTKTKLMFRLTFPHTFPLNDALG